MRADKYNRGDKVRIKYLGVEFEVEIVIKASDFYFARTELGNNFKIQDRHILEKL